MSLLRSSILTWAFAWAGIAFAAPGPETVAAARAEVTRAPGLAPYELSGDFARLIEERRAYRGLVDALVEEHHPAAASALDPLLDAWFSPTELAKGIALDLGRAVDRSLTAEQTTWVTMPATQRVNAAIRDFAPAGLDEAPEIAPARLAVLQRIERAMGLSIEATLRRERLQRLAAATTDAIVPESTLVAALATSQSQGVDAVPSSLVVSAWLGPALAGFDDATLQAFARGAETEAGKRYFAGHGSLYIEAAQPWYDELVARVQQHGRRKIGTPADRDASLAQVDRLMAGWLPPDEVQQARAILLQLQAAAPDDVEVACRLGQLAIATRGSRTGDGELRAPPERAGNLSEADLHLDHALQIDPRHAGALAARARSAFYQFDDALARQLLDRAKAADAGNPWIAYYEADLLQAEGKHAEAIATYERLLAAPEFSNGTHAKSVLNSRGAYVAVGRGAGFVATARAYLAKHRNDGVRAFLVRHLVDAQAPLADVLAEIDPLPDDPRKQQLVQLAHGADAARAVDATSVSPQEAARSVERAARQEGGLGAAVSQACLAGADGLARALALATTSGDPDALSAAAGCAVLHRKPGELAGLVKAGADLDRATVPMYRSSALHVAGTIHMDPGLVRELLAQGAAPALKNAEGKTLREALSGWEADRAREIVALLDQADPAGAAASDSARRDAIVARAAASEGGVEGRLARLCNLHAGRDDIAEAVALVESAKAGPAAATRVAGCAVKQNLAPELKRMIAEGADVNARSLPMDDMALLAFAAEHGHLEVFELLLLAGADPAARVSASFDATVHTLLAHRDDDVSRRMKALLAARAE